MIRTVPTVGVATIENLCIPMGDGTRLAAKLWRPKSGPPVPAILEYLPYRKGDGTRTRDQAMHLYWAAHGYACLRVDIRGTGDSEGTLHDEYTPQEQIDGCAVIDWIAGQDWCDGQVAMMGISWGGFNGLQIAARQPPALRTVIAVGFTDDRYATDVHYIGGCLSKDNLDWSATMVASQDLPPDPVHHGPAWRDLWRDRMAANVPWGLTWLCHQRRDAYWKQGSVCEDFSAIRVPVYAVSGWADNYSEAVPRLLAGLDVPRRGLIGPWAHSFPHDVTVGPAIGWLQEVLRWCDHWLKGRDTGIMDEPMLRVWMQDSVPPATYYTTRPGRWVGEAVWPSPEIVKNRLYTGPNGLNLTLQSGESRICSPLWVGLGSGEVGRYGGDADWPGDQREDDGGSRVWMSEPLTKRTEILGAPQFHLRFSADKPQALVAVRLNDIAPDGRSTRVALGLLNLTHHASHEEPEALIPGHIYNAVVDLDDIAHAFPPGHRIGVSVSTTYWPIAWPSPELATVTLEHRGTWLSLPVRPPRASDAALRPFDLPEQAANTPSVTLATAPTHPRRVVRDLLSGQMTVDFPRWTYATTMEDTGVTVRSEGWARYEITDGDPLSATLTTEYRVDLIRPDTVIRHQSTSSLRCTATDFLFAAEIVLHEGEAEVFRRTWDEIIPRDHL